MKNTLMLLFLTFISIHLKAQESQPNDPSKKPINLDSLVNSRSSLSRDSLIPLPKERMQEPRMMEVDPTATRYRYSRDYQGKVKTKYNSSHDIKTLSSTSSHRGGFGALSFRATSFRDESMVLAGLRGGWIVSRALALGFEGHGIIPTAKYTDISNPTGKRVVAIGGYGGFFLEPIFFSNEVIHVTFPVSAGAGWMGFQEDWEDNLLRPNNSGWGSILDEDIYWYVEPGVALELNVARNFRVNLGVSKRMTQDLKMIDTKASDFDSWTVFLTLKIGKF